MDKLVITEQTCLLEEKFSKNGVQKNVHVVVKNTPFSITVALADPAVNFNQHSADVQLVYDCSTLKEVDFVKLKPMDYKLKSNEDGDQLTVELRIKVLTSQLEDMFFRVRIALIDPHTLQELSPNYMVLSHPIRVVSKPDQVKKKIKKRKRAPTDNLMDTLSRIEAQQKEQQRLLKKLCVLPTDLSVPRPNAALQEGADAFHAAFTDFLAAFTQLSTSDDSAYKVNTSVQDAQTMCEILDLIRAELKRQYGHLAVTESPPLPAASLSIVPPPSSLPLLSSLVDSHTGLHSSCSCNNCPYREKERVDSVSSLEGELFSVPLSSCSTDMSNNMSMQPLGSFPFGPFHDLSSMFRLDATQ